MHVQNRVLWILGYSIAIGAIPCDRSTANEGLAGSVVGIDFDRDVRPILSDFCFGCHGPDAQARQADLRMDIEEGFHAKLDDGPLIVSGSSEKSELVRRIVSDDESLRMPPPKFGRRLNAEQIGVIRRWIDSGGKWNSHWSFRKIERPQLPPQTTNLWEHNPLDRFLSSAHQQENIQPAQPAVRTTLARRLSLDLLGVPPTYQDAADFVEDESPSALENYVDRLLASPKFGERMAIDWLDGARYADTSGYQNDGPRYMWRWRDWVIDAFNRNMPFDQFTIEQIAGDLIPNADLEQRIATGFQRNHRGNAEGGIVPEEFAVEYVVDRIETTCAVWLGLTIGCARCHDHKYDPISQKEFYQLYAFFNNIPETGRAIKEGNSPPYIQSPTDEQKQELTALTKRVESAQVIWETKRHQLVSLQEAWEQQQRQIPTLHDSHTDSLAPGKPRSATELRLASAYWWPKNGLQWYMDEIAASPSQQVDLFSSNGRISTGEGPISKSIELDGTEMIEVGDIGKFGYFDKFTLAAWIRPRQASGTILSRMLDVAQADGYYLVLDRGHLQLNLVKRWLDDALRVQTSESIPLDQWSHVAVVYDGTRRATGVRFYINGQLQTNQVNLDQINQSFVSPQPLRIGGGHGPENRFHGNIAEVAVYARVLENEEVAAMSASASILTIVGKDQRTDGERAKLSAYFLDHVAPTEFRDAFSNWRMLHEQWQQQSERLPTVMVMQESSEIRPAFVLARGQYDQPLEKVSAAVPTCLPSLSSDAPRNRLGLANWLVSRDQPLTARVIVNRYWQMLFGVGLVKTSEDFGLQGERPSHPELLDWLASDFIESGWDVKRLLKLIVTSSAYQQSSASAREIWARDPENRLIARGARFRLPAESIRDSALAASGLIMSTIGGPSTKPYQPEGLWSEIATDTDYDRSRGADLYRRSLYTYWKRTVAPPVMQTLDAPSRETCVVRRPVTNTPLQALLMMNEEGFLEAARLLALRSIREAGVALNDRLDYAFQLVLSRRPNSSEQAVLLKCWKNFERRYRHDPSSAAQVLSMGDTHPAISMDTVELAAYTAVASLILNLDEAVTKE